MRPAILPAFFSKLLLVRYCKPMSRFNPIALLLAIFLFSGCSSSSVQTYDDYKDTNIRRCYNSYILYMQYHNYVGPKNEAEFKAYFASDPTAKVLVERMGVDPMGMDKIMISERDGQAFKFRWGVAGVDDQPIVFEAEGRDGKRLVAYSNVKELSAEEAQKLLDSPVNSKFQAKDEIDLGGDSAKDNFIDD